MPVRPATRRATRRIVTASAAALGVAALASACSTATSPARPASPSASKAPSGPQAPIKDAQGQQIGAVAFVPVQGGVKVEVDVRHLTPGFHGFHIHSAAKCEPKTTSPDGKKTGDFLSAGGHWMLGQHVPGQPMTGDLPALLVTKDGTAKATMLTDAFTISQLTADGGKAVVVHAGPDNHGHIPAERYTAKNGGPVPDEQSVSTGDAGDRVGCGVVS